MSPPRSFLLLLPPLRLTLLLRPLPTHLTHTHLPNPNPLPHPSPPPVLRLDFRQKQQQQQQYSTTAPPSQAPTSTPTSPSPSPPKPYTFTDIQHLTASPSPTRLIIDVREPAELRQTGKIPGALSMPLTSNPDAFYLDGGAFFERFGFEKPRARVGGGGGGGGEGKEGGGDGDDGEAGHGEAQGGVEEVIFYCKAGVRSRAAARMAREWVGVRAGDMKGGWMEWEAKGGEVER